MAGLIAGEPGEWAGVRSDYGNGRVMLLVLALLVVGARRLEHLQYIGGDPLIGRLCGLHRLPPGRHRQPSSAAPAPEPRHSVGCWV